MPISRADFDGGKDPGSVESKVEQFLAKSGKAHTTEEIADEVYGVVSGSTDRYLRNWSMSMTLREMVSSMRILEKVIDNKSYYASKTR
jgi:hypothetical protein